MAIFIASASGKKLRSRLIENAAKSCGKPPRATLRRALGLYFSGSVPDCERFRNITRPETGRRDAIGFIGHPVCAICLAKCDLVDTS
jgi:hypothetical protein